MQEERWDDKKSGFLKEGAGISGIYNRNLYWL